MLFRDIRGNLEEISWLESLSPVTRISILSLFSFKHWASSYHCSLFIMTVCHQGIGANIIAERATCPNLTSSPEKPALKITLNKITFFHLIECSVHVVSLRFVTLLPPVCAMWWVCVKAQKAAVKTCLSKAFCLHCSFPKPVWKVTTSVVLYNSVLLIL